MATCEQCRAEYQPTLELSLGVCEQCDHDLTKEAEAQRQEDWDTYWEIVRTGISGIFEREE
jgi:hypothetical protein